MQIHFCGANNETTGSKHLLNINGVNILLDCGMFQGKRWEARKKNENFLFDPKELDFVILSHAHIDHSGLLPLLVKKGYHKKIYCTKATKDLVAYLLMDSAHIQESDAIYFNSKKHDKNEHIYPLYDKIDAQMAIYNIVGFEYDEWIELTSNIRYKHLDAGHILGSSQILIEYDENGIKKRILYSGDLGRKNMPLLRDPVIIDYTDTLILESTYGNRLHEDYNTVLPKLADIVNNVVNRGGKIIIPAFALERAQELIYNFARLYEQKKIPGIPVYVDSPLTLNITSVFEKYMNLYDKEAVAFLSKNNNPFHLKNIYYIENVEESKKLQFRQDPCIIISAQGMCEAGRILHHLKNNISNPKNLLLIVGYQATNTLGRKLEDGEKEVKIFGEMYKVNMEVISMHSFSAHADYHDIIEHYKYTKNIKDIFLVHGENESSESLKQHLQENNIGKNIVIPQLNTIYEV